jgi:hypothetical protein
MHAAGLGLGADLVELVDLARLRRHDELTEPLMRDAALAAIGVKTVASGNAEPCLQAALRIIDAGMDDFRITRARFGADAVGGFEDENVTPGECQRARRRQTDDARPDDGAINLIHGNQRASCSAACPGIAEISIGEGAAVAQRGFRFMQDDLAIAHHIYTGSEIRHARRRLLDDEQRHAPWH